MNNKFASFAARRRLLDLLYRFLSNGVLPFFLGYMLAVFTTSSSLIEIFNSIDKNALSLCAISKG